MAPIDNGGALHAAIAHLQTAEQQLATQLAATREALTALRAVGGVPAALAPKVERRQKPVEAPRINGKPGNISEDAIRAALKGGPLAPSELQGRLKASKYQLRVALDPLISRGIVVASGTTQSRRVALPGAPGKEALPR